MSSTNPKPPKKTLLRNLGEFFGHVAHGIASDPNGPKPPETAGVSPVAPPEPGAIVRSETHERIVSTPEGPLVLRRTVIDEVRAIESPPGPHDSGQP